MRWFNGYRVRLLSVGFAAAVVLGGGQRSAKADFVFGTPTNLGPTINSPSGEGPDCFSSDGLEMYLDSDRPGGSGGWDIWVAKRATIDDDWGTPTNLGPKINGPTSDACASISFDGLELYFVSRGRAGGRGSGDIWVSTRQNKEADWGTPVNLGPIVNGPSWESAPWIATDGLELYFDSNRSGGSGSFDIWVSRRATRNDPWGQPTNLGSVVNGPDGGGYSFVFTDGLLLLGSDDLLYGPFRAGGFGSSDMWMSSRTAISDPWVAPVNLGPLVNGTSGEYTPRISPEGLTLYFGSTGRVGMGGAGGDIWQAPIVPVVDFNGDGRIGVGDLVTLIDKWGTDESLCDVGPMPWGDGKVDAADLEVLMSYWGQEAYDPTLIAHWKLDETEGIIAHDHAGTNHGTILGLPQWRPQGGRIDGALELNGTTCVTATSALNPSDGPFSVFAWVKGGAPGQVVISQETDSNWLMLDPATGALMTELKSGGRSAKVLYSDAVITDGNWHRVGFTWDGSHRRLYVDEVLVAEDIQDSLAATSRNLVLGAGKTKTPGTFWSGLLDDVRIYSRAIKP